MGRHRREVEGPAPRINPHWNDPAWSLKRLYIIAGALFIVWIGVLGLTLTPVPPQPSLGVPQVGQTAVVPSPASTESPEITVDRFRLAEGREIPLVLDYRVALFLVAASDTGAPVTVENDTAVVDLGIAICKINGDYSSVAIRGVMPDITDEQIVAFVSVVRDHCPTK